MKWISFIFRVIGIVLDIIGIGGFSDDIKQWGIWKNNYMGLNSLDQNTWRWIFVIVGTGMIAAPTIWKKLLKKELKDVSLGIDPNDLTCGMSMLNDLMDESLDISNRILRFAYERELNGPGFPNYFYDRKTMLLFSQKFRDRIISVYSKLKSQGITDEQFEYTFRNIKDLKDIQTIGERFNVIAQNCS